MESPKQLANRFREVILDGRWIANTNYREQLSGTGWQMANTKFFELNTLSALTFHIRYYITGVLLVLEGGELEIRDEYSFDFIPCQNQEEWELMLSGFWNDAERFAAAVESLTEDLLDEVFVQEKYGTYRRNIESMIEHCYYHLGQVVLIRKVLTAMKTG